MVFISMLIVFALILGLFIRKRVALKFEKIAFQKGYDSSIHSFAMCFWLGIVGYLYVIALPDLNICNNIKTAPVNKNVNISRSNEGDKNKQKYDN